MKYLLLYILLMLLLACKKTNSDGYWGTVSAEQNGMPWDAKIYATRNTSDYDLIDIEIQKYNNQGFLREDLYFFKLKLTNEQQRIYFTTANDLDLRAGANYGTLEDDGDVVCDNYHVMPGDSLRNQITLTQINNGTGEIRGNFELRLVIDTGRRCNPVARDTIHFKNGSL